MSFVGVIMAAFTIIKEHNKVIYRSIEEYGSYQSAEDAAKAYIQEKKNE